MRGEDPIPLIAPTSPRTPLPAGASTPGCLEQWLTWLRTHRRTRTTGLFAPTSPGPAGRSPARSGPLRGRADLPRRRLQARCEQPGSEQPPMPGEGRAGHQWRGKGAREGGTKARRRGRGSDGGEECGAGWRGRGGREDATRRRDEEPALGAGGIVGQAAPERFPGR